MALCGCALLSLQVILGKLHQTFETPVTTAEAREKQAEVQGQLCGVLQVSCFARLMAPSKSDLARRA